MMPIIVGMFAHLSLRLTLMHILLIFAGKEDMHESLDEWEVKPDPTKDYSVSCP